MNDIPILNLVPEKYRGWVVFGIWAGPYLLRGCHALYNGRGLVGVIKGVLLGTNTSQPAAPESAAAQIQNDTYHAP
jgi:hypothetical protein